MGRQPETLYPVEELLYRPLEHVVESLSCWTLERLTGIGHSWWHEVKRGVHSVPSPIADRLHNPQVNRRKRKEVTP